MSGHLGISLMLGLRKLATFNGMGEPLGVM